MINLSLQAMPQSVSSFIGLSPEQSEKLLSALAQIIEQFNKEGSVMVPFPQLEKVLVLKKEEPAEVQAEIVEPEKETV